MELIRVWGSCKQHSSPLSSGNAHFRAGFTRCALFSWSETWSGWNLRTECCFGILVLLAISAAPQEARTQHRASTLRLRLEDLAVPKGSLGHMVMQKLRRGAGFCTQAEKNQNNLFN